MLKHFKWDISSAGLHVLAMIFMLCDHLWGTLFISHEWLTCIGRMAFPIFAFMIAEGYRHTKNINHYMFRMFICAIFSEIPINLMIGGSVIYPYHQNVIWTFLISLFIIRCIDKIKVYFSPINASFISVAIILIGFIIGFATIVDYYGVGVLTVLVFYYYPNGNWKSKFMQFLCLFILHVEIMGGYCYAVSVFGFELKIPQQGIALFSLIFIWLYHGRQGIHDKRFQYFCYAFYPVHMLILALIRIWIIK